MNWYLILGYLALLLIQYLAIQSILVTLFSSLLNLIYRNLMLNLLLGSILTWFILNYIWLKIYDFNIPIFALILSLAFQLIHGNISYNELSETSRKSIVAESWAILIFGAYIIIFKDFIWF